jgi:hypothetical protein
MITKDIRGVNETLSFCQKNNPTSAGLSQKGGFLNEKKFQYHYYTGLLLRTSYPDINKNEY